MKLKLFDADKNKLWEKTIDRSEYDHLREITDPNLTRTSLYAQVLTPVRTHALTSMAVDLFFPFSGTALSVVGMSGCMRDCKRNPVIFPVTLPVVAMLELITMPVRLATLIPRACYNASQPEHPFRTWLYQNGAPAECLEPDMVTIRIDADLSHPTDRSKPSLIFGTGINVNFFAPNFILNTHPEGLTDLSIKYSEYQDQRIAP